MFRKNRFCLKHTKLLSCLILITLIVCTPKRKGIDDDGFILLLLQTRPEPGANSVVSLRRIDTFNFTGICLDNFFGISAKQYFQTMNLQNANSDWEKHILSEQSCSNLGFRLSGPRTQSQSGIEYSTYQCGTNANPCSRSLASSMGFLL
ncbi:hypothetical protein LPTSP4_16000 [Leptospira ryugenii]|uniref:Uncharacterized protein n=1 Tax=Leptospira ryugenii TaxID=1917863 RepID=A0A2P2DZM7_9LEPT|nr:hypothetical protein [Leptospira ryugenii]GBF50077.1 hypothetical protein LPTSP4_16000 [Leptospira ryugenii]